MSDRDAGTVECPVCDWLMNTVQTGGERINFPGCVPGNCAYRPREGSKEWHRIQKRRFDLGLDSVPAGQTGETLDALIADALGAPHPDESQWRKELRSLPARYAILTREADAIRERVAELERGWREIDAVFVEACDRFDAEYTRVRAEVMPALTPATKGGGELLVGTNYRGEVVINLDKDRTGHIVFSTHQARALAQTLVMMADRAVRETVEGGRRGGDDA